MLEKLNDAAENFDTCQNLQHQRAFLPAIAATVAATIAPCMYTLQAIVAATIASWLLD